MEDPNQLLEFAKALGGSLLAVTVTALSAPVTGNRLRLWRLERLNAVIDKTPVDDPARAYLQAEVRGITTWWAAINATRLSWAARGLIIFELWLTVNAVVAIVWWIKWPEQLESLGSFPPAQWWFNATLGSFALLRLLYAARRRRVERVRFYNALIESGPDEFKLALRKRFRVPALGMGVDFRQGQALERPPPRATGHQLEAQKIRTCPNGHPITGANVYFSDYNFDNDPPRSLLCGRCGVALPAPLTREVDEDEASVVAIARHRREKRRKREAKAAVETKPVDDEKPTVSAAEVADDSAPKPTP